MKYYEKLKEFLDGELGDYSCFKYEIDCTDKEGLEEYYEVEVTDGDKTKTLYFKLNDAKIEIDTNEDCFEEVVSYDWRVKYFWIALLKWE